MKTSASDYYEYRNICKLAATNSGIFNVFRSDRSYNIILENVPELAGKQCLDILIKNGMTDLSKYQDIEKYGGPRMSNYGDYGIWSPTTIRYIKVYLDLLVGYKKPDPNHISVQLDNAKIIEVGGGYGGQAFVIKKNHNVDYHIYDLPEPLMLTEKFLSNLNQQICGHNALEPITENSCDLFISTCALSEINRDIQDEYFEKIICNSKRGYITYNTFTNAYPVNIFFDKVKFYHSRAKIFDENPVTGPNNKAITW